MKCMCRRPSARSRTASAAASSSLVGSSKVASGDRRPSMCAGWRGLCGVMWSAARWRQVVVFVVLPALLPLAAALKMMRGRGLSRDPAASVRRGLLWRESRAEAIANPPPVVVLLPVEDLPPLARTALAKAAPLIECALSFGGQLPTKGLAIFLMHKSWSAIAGRAPMPYDEPQLLKAAAAADRRLASSGDGAQCHMSYWRPAWLNWFAQMIHGSTVQEFTSKRPATAPRTARTPGAPAAAGGGVQRAAGRRPDPAARG